MEVYLQLLSASTLDRSELSASHSGRFIHLVKGWFGPVASLDNLEKRSFLPLPGIELRSLGAVVARL